MHGINLSASARSKMLLKLVTKKKAFLEHGNLKADMTITICICSSTNFLYHTALLFFSQKKRKTS